MSVAFSRIAEEVQFDNDKPYNRSRKTWKLNVNMKLI